MLGLFSTTYAWFQCLELDLSAYKIDIQVAPYHDRTYDCYGIYVKREKRDLTRFCEKVGFS